VLFRSVNWEQGMSNVWDSFAGERQLVQYKFTCCGYLSVLDRPYVDDQCTGLVDSSFSSPSNSTVFRRDTAQVVNSQACHDNWTRFVASYLMVGYSVAFTLVPFCLFTFMIGMLAANHIYD